MIMHVIHMPKKQFALEDLDNVFWEIVSVLKYLIPIWLALLTMLIYVSALPLSLLAILFTFINKKYHKRLPARSLCISSSICWLWLTVVVLLT
jgi:hypothetical protein